MLLERYNKCIAAGGDYFEGDYSFMCVVSIKMPIRKSMETYLTILVLWTLPEKDKGPTHSYGLQNKKINDNTEDSMPDG